MSTPIRLVLASASPRRRELLAQAGYSFAVRAADVDESQYPGEMPQDYVRRLALKKVRAIAALEPDTLVLGADTTVVCEGAVLNKPRDLEDAERMLRFLSGRTHQVHTGLAAILGERAASLVETTYVTFREIRDLELRTYLQSGDPMDKAGAYGIQGYAARWIPRIEGDYFNVVGLPIAAVVKLINSLG